MADQFDSQTPPEEVLQDEQEDTPALVVDVPTPVRTHVLPSRRVAMYTLNDVTSTQAVRIDADPRRASLVLVGDGTDIRVGTTQGAAQDAGGAGGAAWPVGAQGPARGRGPHGCGHAAVTCR